MLSEFLKIGPFVLSGYSFFYLLGLAVGCAVVLVLASREKLDRLETANYLLFTVIISVLGAKLAGAIVILIKHPADSLAEPCILWQALKKGGIFYGGLIPGAVFACFYLRTFFRPAFWKMLDLTAIGAALGHAIGRVGCFMGGCCFGRPTGLPWGVEFKNLGRLPHPYAHTAVHPTQIYEAGLNLLNFVVLLLIREKRKGDGRVFAFYLVNYGIIRFLVEYFRNEEGRSYLFRGSSPLASLSIQQLLSAALIAVGLWTLKRRRRASSLTR